ncbi:hypothetical protein PROFUN_13201, partial [Planoprotostelium fungivorum]
MGNCCGKRKDERRPLLDPEHQHAPLRQNEIVKKLREHEPDIASAPVSWQKGHSGKARQEDEEAISKAISETSTSQTAHTPTKSSGAYDGERNRIDKKREEPDYLLPVGSFKKPRVEATEPEPIK